MRPGWRPLIGVLAALIAGCAPTAHDRPDWVIATRLVFRSEDLTREQPVPTSPFRLRFPFIAGDLYGAPTTGDFLHPELDAGLNLRIDLNRGHRSLLASLQPTEFSLPYLHVEPAAARLARLAPMILEADGIEPLGRVEWLDPDTTGVLLLLYLDRPAAIAGQTRVAGRTVRYDIRVPAPGYFWVGRQSRRDEDVYTVVPRPARLLLAVALPAGQQR